MEIYTHTLQYRRFKNQTKDTITQRMSSISSLTFSKICGSTFTITLPKWACMKTLILNHIIGLGFEYET